jgi:hypothetical protein
MFMTITGDGFLCPVFLVVLVIFVYDVDDYFLLLVMFYIFFSFCTVTVFLLFILKCTIILSMSGC